MSPDQVEDEPAAPAEPGKEPKDVEEILKGFKGIPGEFNVRARDRASPNADSNPNPDLNRCSSPA